MNCTSNNNNEDYTSNHNSNYRADAKYNNIRNWNRIWLKDAKCKSIYAGDTRGCAIITWLTTCIRTKRTLIKGIIDGEWCASCWCFCTLNFFILKRSPVIVDTLIVSSCLLTKWIAKITFFAWYCHSVWFIAWSRLRIRFRIRIRLWIKFANTSFIYRCDASLAAIVDSLATCIRTSRAFRNCIRNG
jgi:hypothetical protein